MSRSTSTPHSSTRAWDALVDGSPQGSLFCRTWWLDAVAPGRYELLTVNRGDEIRAGWPVVWAKSGDRSTVQMPPLTHKLGILFASHEGKYAERLSRECRLAGELIQQLPSRAYVDQRFHEGFTNWLPFYWRGYQQATRYTYVLDDLADLTAIWAQMRRKTRTEIRKAQKAGIRVRETGDVEYFYALNAKIFGRQGLRVPYSLQCMQRIDEACVKNAGRRLAIAETPDGQPCACRYLVHDDQCAFVLAGGVDEGQDLCVPLAQRVIGPEAGALEVLTGEKERDAAP